MIDKKLEDAFNAQINQELYSSYLYLSMAAYLQSIGLQGFSNWMKIQVQEEAFHAKLMFEYLIERGGQVVLDKIDKPDSEWKSLLQVYEKTLSHEQHVTKLINKLMDVAEEVKDRSAQSFLDWFINEQTEEEATAADMVSKLKLIGADGSAIYLLDKETATRVFVAPVVK